MTEWNGARLQNNKGTLIILKDPPWRNSPWRGEGAYLTKRFSPSASTSRARWSDAATFDKD